MSARFCPMQLRRPREKGTKTLSSRPSRCECRASGPARRIPGTERSRVAVKGVGLGRYNDLIEKHMSYLSEHKEVMGRSRKEKAREGEMAVYISRHENPINHRTAGRRHPGQAGPERGIFPHGFVHHRVQHRQCRDILIPYRPPPPAPSVSTPFNSSLSLSCHSG
jgi:hypothetical protein